MTLWTNEQISLALNCKVDFEFKAERVVIDSRKVREGDLFVAIAGENFNGNEFASDAIKNGAVAAIISDEKYQGDKAILCEQGGIYALERLAYMRRKNSNAKIIGITGSVGKTTVKELLATTLQDYYSIHKTDGNLNNHIGLPLSIANMSESTKIGIFEMGMSASGEISKLSRIAHPDIAIITNIGTSHIEFFDSQEGIALAKAEIFDWLKVDGFAVIPADSKYFSLIEEVAENNGVMNILSFGEKINNPVITEDGYISAHILVERYKIPQKVCDDFTLSNILAVLTVVAQIGVDVDDAIDAISSMEPFEGRGNKIGHSSGAVIINDAYNASPESMKNSITNLKNNKSATSRIAVLGDMLELGGHAKKLHADLAAHLEGLDKIYLCGENMKELASVQNAKHFDSLENLQTELEGQLKKGDIVLIKGSNGSKMWKIVEHLKNH